MTAPDVQSPNVWNGPFSTVILSLVYCATAAQPIQTSLSIVPQLLNPYRQASLLHQSCPNRTNKPIYCTTVAQPVQTRLRQSCPNHTDKPNYCATVAQPVQTSLSIELSADWFIKRCELLAYAQFKGLERVFSSVFFMS